MKNLVVHMTILFFLISCVRSNEKNGLPTYIDKIETTKLSGASIINPDLLGHPSRLWIKEDSLIVLDVEDKYIYSLFHLKGDGNKERFGKIGNGPNEFMQPACLQIDSDGITYAYDASQKKMYKFDTVRNLINWNDSSEFISIKEKTGGFLCKTTHGFVGDCLYGDGRMLQLFNNEGNLIDSFGSIPESNATKSANPNYYMTYQIQFVVSPDKKYLCAAGTYHDWLAFFDISGDNPVLLKEYYSSSPIVRASGKDDEYHLDLLPETVNHYWSIAPYNNGFYINYIGANQGLMTNGDISNTIIQSDFNGNLIKRYIPDKKIGFIASSLNGKLLYGVSFMNSYDTPDIFKFVVKP